jgi:hypothetical protein
MVDGDQGALSGSAPLLNRNRVGNQIPFSVTNRAAKMCVPCPPVETGYDRYQIRPAAERRMVPDGRTALFAGGVGKLIAMVRGLVFAGLGRN